MIRRAAFAPVFQPIVDLQSGRALGYEALTRFADGTRPDLVFAQAARLGLGAELEKGTLAAAIAAAGALPRGTFLSLNVSPALLLGDGSLPSAVEAAAREVVLEITEHEVIADYARLRERLLIGGRRLPIAVDDAGAGVANFTHLVELRPNFVKVDVGLVRGVDTDVGRQAIVAALLHFARQTGCRVIAEGVETDAERAALMQLGVELAQGYLFGKPAPAETWGRPPVSAARRPRTRARITADV